MADQRNPAEVFSVLAGLPAAQLMLLCAAAIVWLVGGNWLSAACCRRIGKPWWHAFRPGTFVVRHFGSHEWFWLAALAAVSLALIILAVTVAAPPGA
ncbi:hypothetical protein [Lysobacter sp. HA18]